MDPADYAELKLLAGLLARRKEIELSQCFGKTGFDNRVDAQRSIRPKARGEVEVYRCGTCARYHVGGQSEVRKVLKARKAQWRRRCVSQ